MPVNVGFCDVCLELECEDPDLCDAERKRLTATCDACGESDCTDPKCIESALARRRNEGVALGAGDYGARNLRSASDEEEA